MNYPPFNPKPPQFPWSLPPPAKPASVSFADLIAFQSAPKPTLLGELFAETNRPRIFISYQHSSDQAYYDLFSKTFHDGYESVYDNSLRGRIRSDDPEYVIQRIRDDFISGTSCTIVLVGPTSYQRKYLDWEIKATLDKEHGLIGIQLPNVVPSFDGKVFVPPRLNANINSGYALWHELSWQQLVSNPAMLNSLVQVATTRDTGLIVNPHEIKKQNG